MAAARHALTTASKPPLIFDVAHRCGYVNIGRFDAHYLDAYGRLPEDDLNPAEKHTPAQQ